MSPITKTKATIVAKEDVVKFTFPRQDVLRSEIKKKERETRLKRAMKIGNNFKGKVKIIFEDNEGIKKVETTIWGITPKNILLKKTTLIPIRRIHEIKFY